MSSLELEDYARQIDSVNAAAQALVGNHTVEQLTRPTPSGGWSAVECLDHIAKTVNSYIPGIRGALKEGRAKGQLAEGPFRYGFMARMFLWIIEPPARLRVKAPNVFKPSPQPDVQSTLQTYLQQHGELQKLLEEADGMDLAAIRVTSPANEKMKLPVGAVFGILTAHARRHLLQARRALSESGT